MKRGTLWTVLIALCSLANAACSSSSPNQAITVTITTAPTTLATGAMGNVVATVANDSANGGVTWNCTPAASCGTASFNPDKTASGATSTFTAPATIPAGNQVTITATSVTDNSIVSAPVNITITAAVVPSKNFSFYLTGEDAANLTIYSVAGVVEIANAASADGSFAVLGGEQDYNDGDGITVTDDSFTTGKLVLAANETGTLTLTTTSGVPGVNGTETFAVSFPNNNHALITQFDASATASGSLDLQSSNSLPSGSFSFVTYGVDPDFAPIVTGGVFTVAPTTGALSGTVDVNDGGDVVLGTPIPAGAALAAPDNFGRGVVTGSTGIATSLVYYIVGTQVLRIINVDTKDTAVGSAYGQGPNPNFTPASIGTSVFSIGSTLGFYAAVGQFTTVPGAAMPSFSGIGDENESVLNSAAPGVAQSIDGTYALPSNGYGSLAFTDGLGSMLTLGMYAVNPTLNILDPNNTTSGRGGALIAEMDQNLVGIGSLVPQTDATTASFSGSYAFGAQGVAGPPDEFDFVGVATVKPGTFTGTGFLSDPFAIFTHGVDSPTATFTASATPDPVHLGVGRYTLNPLAVGTSGNDFTPFDLNTVTAYQAYGGQLFWIEVDDFSVFEGSLQQN